MDRSLIGTKSMDVHAVTVNFDYLDPEDDNKIDDIEYTMDDEDVESIKIYYDKIEYEIHIDGKTPEVITFNVSEKKMIRITPKTYTPNV